MRILIFALLFTAGCASIPTVPDTWKCHADLECEEECMARGFESEYCFNWYIGD